MPKKKKRVQTNRNLVYGHFHVPSLRDQHLGIIHSSGGPPSYIGLMMGDSMDLPDTRTSGPKPIPRIPWVSQHFEIKVRKCWTFKDRISYTFELFGGMSDG